MDGNKFVQKMKKKKKTKTDGACVLRVLRCRAAREENVNSDASAARAVFHFAAYWFWFCVARLYCICSSTRIHIHIWIKVARVVWQTSRNSERRREFSISSLSAHSLSVSWQIKRENGFAIASIDSGERGAATIFLRLRHDRKSRWCVMQLLFKMPPLLAAACMRESLCDTGLLITTLTTLLARRRRNSTPGIKMCYGLFFAPINTLGEDWWYIRFCWKQLMDPDCISLNGLAFRPLR
jgi:hypothetical protein